MGVGVSGLGVYLDRRLLIVLAMGFSSGLPLALSGATLSYWLKTVGVSKSAIGLFALVGLAYSLKFLWAPLFDHVAAPVIGRLTGGRRRPWMLVTQTGLILALLATGATDPATAPWWTALAAVFVALFSASQDIVIDAYRIEILREDQQGAGAAVTQYGYRIGILASGAGGLYLSEMLSWFGVYAVMAGLVGIGMMTTLLCPEPDQPVIRHRTARPIERVRIAVIDPFVEFMRRRRWPAILGFVVLYKLGDAIAGVMATPFYVELGFSADEIATVSKIFGLGATVLGIFIGGWLVGAIGLARSLLIGGILQGGSTLMYAVLALAGHDVPTLAATIFVENVTGGIGSAAFVAYLSSLCAREFTATQYALLTSLSAMGRTLLASSGGFIAERLDWVTFFGVAAFLALPGIALLLYLIQGGLDRGNATADQPPEPAAGAS